MLFNSFQYLIFFLVVTIVFFLTAHRYRWILLLAASYYFYMNWNPVYSLLMFSTTLATYLSALGIAATEKIINRKIFLWASLLVNFGVLFFFKYYNFINESLLSVMASFGVHWSTPHFSLLLPVGISFHAFQSVGYTIDVYRKDIQPERHFGIFALFIAFFPQLVAGPIERAKHMLPQFRQIHLFDATRISSGLRIMLWGFFIKVVIADRAAIYVDTIYNNLEHHTGASMFLATILFSIQIYCDFAGYSLIALGTGKVLGYDLMVNFKRPYFAATITQFWRRWHISLSTWFKDYLYFPLGGNKVSRPRNYFNLFITFIVSGLWHGANWTFVIWGALHGFVLIMEKFFSIAHRNASIVLRALQYMATMAVVVVAWIFFRANTVQDSFIVLNKIFTNISSQLFVDKKTFFYLSISIPILIVVEVMQEFYPGILTHSLSKPVFRYPAYFLLIVFIMLIGVFDGGQFIYFQF